MKIIDKFKFKGKEDMVDSEILIIQSFFYFNIVKLYEVYETETEIYLIMEYVQGGDFFDVIIENVKFLERDVVFMFMDLCKAFVYMYDKSIVYRDFKLENLLVSFDFVVVGEGVYKIEDIILIVFDFCFYTLEYYFYGILIYSFQYLKFIL